MNDLGFAIRQLTRRPGFTGTALLVLAIGIGASTAVFSVFDTLLVRSLGLAHEDRVVFVWGADRSTGAREEQISFPDFADLRAGSDAFTTMAALRTAGHSGIWRRAGRATPVGGGTGRSRGCERGTGFAGCHGDHGHGFPGTPRGFSQSHGGAPQRVTRSPAGGRLGHRTVVFRRPLTASSATRPPAVPRPCTDRRARSGRGP